MGKTIQFISLDVLRNNEAALAEPLSEPASAATFAFPAEPMEPGKRRMMAKTGRGADAETTSCVI